MTLTAKQIDLGAGRRNYVTSHDTPVPIEVQRANRILEQTRQLNQRGSAAALLGQQNKSQLDAWNSKCSSLQVRAKITRSRRHSSAEG